MDSCICHTVRQLAKEYKEITAKNMVAALNCHMRDLRAVLTQSKSLARNVQYRITPNNQRTEKALIVGSVNLSPIDEVYTRFTKDANGFWTPSDDVVHTGLRRRLACVVVFLWSKLGFEMDVPPRISALFQQNQNYSDLRYSGRKYIKIARKLGGLGALFWLPLDIPHST